MNFIMNIVTYHPVHCMDRFSEGVLWTVSFSFTITLIKFDKNNFR